MGGMRYALALKSISSSPSMGDSRVRVASDGDYVPWSWTPIIVRLWSGFLSASGFTYLTLVTFLCCWRGCCLSNVTAEVV